MYCGGRNTEKAHTVLNVSKDSSGTDELPTKLADGDINLYCTFKFKLASSTIHNVLDDSTIVGPYVGLESFARTVVAEGISVRMLTGEEASSVMI
jgi:hypothetical protein